MAKGKKIKEYQKKIRLAALMLIIGVSAFFLYTDKYYHASKNALVLIQSSALINDQKNITIIPESTTPETGFIFYPGAKVAPEAYTPLMNQIAQQGYLCVITKMPYNFAFFDSDAAKEVIAAHPEIKNWYIGGHSLGGAIAASFAADHSKCFDGLILLASYSTTDLSSSSLKVLSLYGSHDQILNKEHLLENRINMPNSYQEICIEGGNHANFGDYGTQKGDGIADITRAYQQQITSQAICDFLQ